MRTLDWKLIDTPRALLIGHDPRLRNSDTIAEYALFANYFFDKTIKDKSFRKKYGLASSSFNQLTDITNGKIKPEEVYVTNLCNFELPHAPNKKTVYIPEDIARKGVKNIRRIIDEYKSIKYIFPMSLQVNYWLQKLGFYYSSDEFIKKSTPKIEESLNNPPYYEPAQSKSFLLICGNKYNVNDGPQIVIPILHSKRFPLNERSRAYKPAYDNIRRMFTDLDS